MTKPTNMITPPKTPNHGTSSQHPQQVTHPHHGQDHDLNHDCTAFYHLPGSTRRCQRQERGCLQLPRGIRGLLLRSKVSPQIICCVEKLFSYKIISIVTAAVQIGLLFVLEEVLDVAHFVVHSDEVLLVHPEQQNWFPFQFCFNLLFICCNHTL